MSKRFSILLLLAAVPLFAANERMPLPAGELGPGHAAWSFVAQSLRVIPFDDGSRFVIYRADEVDSKGIAAVLTTRSGVHHFTAESLLPEGSLQPGHIGQIYSAARLGPNALAISIGYVEHGKRVTNAVAFVQFHNGSWTPTGVVDFPKGVRDIAPGPNGTLLAITTDLPRLSRDGIAPLVTVIGSDGKVRGELFPVTGRGADAARNAHSARLLPLGDSKYAVYDEASATVTRFQLVIGKGPAEAVNQSVVSVRALPPGADSARVVLVKGVHVDRQGQVHVVRSFVTDRHQSVETVYSANGTPLETRAIPYEYRVVYWNGEDLNGVPIDRPVD